MRGVCKNAAHCEKYIFPLGRSNAAVYFRRAPSAFKTLHLI